MRQGGRPVSEVIVTSRGPVTVFRRGERELTAGAARNVPADADWHVETFELHQPLGYIADLRIRDGTATVFDGITGQPLPSACNDTGEAVYLTRLHASPGTALGKHASFTTAVDAVATARTQKKAFLRRRQRAPDAEPSGPGMSKDP